MYLLVLLEGFITFVSPCFLPMLPVYLLYFAGSGQAALSAAGGTVAEAKSAAVSRRAVLASAAVFVLGFTLVFTAMGAFAGLLGGLLEKYHFWLHIVTGAVMVLFGLNHIGVLRIGFLNRHNHSHDEHEHEHGHKQSRRGLWASFLLGMVFSVSWTPCMGTFLTASLMLAAQEASVLQGMLMLLCYSLGLGVPFILSGLIIDRLQTAFSFFKKHQKVISLLSGLFLILLGILTMTGVMEMLHDWIGI